MKSLLRFHGRAPVRALASLLVASALALAARAQSELVGTWDGTYEPPGVVGGDPFSLQVTAQEGERVRGTLVLPDLRLADGTETDVGLGYFLEELEGRRLVSHSGGQRKASSFLALLPDERLAVAA